VLLQLDGRGAEGDALGLEGKLGQPEIENLRLTASRHEDVRVLYVPMDDTLRVCSVKSIGDLDAQIEHRFDLHRPAHDPVPERLSLQQFHGYEGSPVGLVDFVDRADIQVAQGGRSLGFPLETAEGLCIVGEFVGKELQGDVTTELEVFRLAHNTHSAAADPAEDAVVRDGLADHWGESYVCETGKSMNAMELAGPQEDSCRKTISLIDPIAASGWPGRAFSPGILDVASAWWVASTSACMWSS